MARGSWRNTLKGLRAQSCTDVEQGDVVRLTGVERAPQFVDQNARRPVRTTPPKAFQLLSCRLLVELLGDSATLLARHRDYHRNG